MADIQSLLDGVIETEIQNLGSLSSGSNEKSKAIQNLATLHKLRIEEIKAETDTDEKRERRKMDSEQRKDELTLKERELNGKEADRDREKTFQNRQVMDQMIDRCMRTGMDIAGLVLPLVFYGIWMNKGFKFEETGSFTSTTFKNLLNRFRPTK